MELTFLHQILKHRQISLSHFHDLFIYCWKFCVNFFMYRRWVLRMINKINKAASSVISRETVTTDEWVWAKFSVLNSVQTHSFVVSVSSFRFYYKNLESGKKVTQARQLFKASLERMSVKTDCKLRVVIEEIFYFETVGVFCGISENVVECISRLERC